MQVEIWSDVACPWCYIGKRRFDRALVAFDGAADVEVRWRSFQLDPTIPPGVRTPHDRSLADKLGASVDQVRTMNERVTALAAEEGLAYDFARYVTVNTHDAHRLAQLARTHGLGAEMHERLLRGQLVDGELLDDAATLERLGVDVGLDREEIRSMLASDQYASDVAEDIGLARMLGVNGVPFFAFDRTFGVSGAQPTELFAEALAQAGTQAAPEPARGA